MMESMMTAQALPASFFYYSPDPNSDKRQHGHFVQHPGAQQVQMLPVVPTLPSTPIYSRPSSSGSRPPSQQPHAFTSVPPNLTPRASPQPVNHKPTIVLETELCDMEGNHFPSTPPLSSAGSVISSPGSFEVLATPLNPMFSGLDGYERAKEVLDVETHLEHFPHLDWSSCTSPPIMPVYLQSHAQIISGKALTVETNNNSAPSELLSSASSLSPSPSPYARSVASEQDVDFCDPRNLTVGTANPTLAPAAAALPTFCPADDGRKFDLRGDIFIKPEPSAALQDSSFIFTADIHHGLPPFDDFSDLESEDDFVNGLVNLGEQQTAQVSRSRASSDAISLGHSSYVCDDDLEGFEDSEDLIFDGVRTPVDSASESDNHRDKRQKKETPKTGPKMNVAATDSQSGATAQETNSQADNDSDESKDSPGSSDSDEAPVPQPTNRRGRKQSLTDDPSKTFVCDVCNRRFRRQEHLKRHYRSLHTQEKPFQCYECGKTFSRSDNLAQHARTHGSGAIVMNLLDDADVAAAAAAGYPHPMMAVGHPEDYQNLGKILFQVAAEIPGSASELSSDEAGSDSQGKKRKRAD